MEKVGSGNKGNSNILPDSGPVKFIRKSLTAWYLKNNRTLPWRKTDDPFSIWVSEMMLQQTQVNTVIPYYQRFVNQFPTIKHLAAADLQQVLKLWEGLGYYARARNFHKAAQMVMKIHDGRVPETWDAFKALPGVGDYIAAAVLSIAFGKPYPVVDGNVKRVLARLFEIGTPVNHSSSFKAFQSIAGKLLNRDDPGMFNQAVMELGALVCKPSSPACDNCPLAKMCLAHQHQNTSSYPVKLKKAPVPEHHIAVGVIFKNNNVLIIRRPERGLLGGLWEFPGGRILTDEPPETACRREIKEKANLTVTIASTLTRIRHAYTHFKIVADIFICDYESGRVRLNGPAAYEWVSLDKLEVFPFHKSNLKFIPHLHKLQRNAR
jgi:A/G-specific adenine glycosylase